MKLRMISWILPLLIFSLYVTAMDDDDPSKKWEFQDQKTRADLADPDDMDADPQAPAAPPQNPNQAPWIPAQLPQNAPVILIRDFAPVPQNLGQQPLLQNPPQALLNRAPLQIIGQLAPLSLHLVAFGAQAAGGDRDVETPKNQIAHIIAHPSIAWRLSLLQIISLAIDLIREDIKLVAANNPPTTYIRKLWDAINLLKRTMTNQQFSEAFQDLVIHLERTMGTPNFNAAFGNRDLLYQQLTGLFGGIMPEDMVGLLRTFETVQIELLKGIDGILPPSPSAPTDVRCLTWQVSPKAGGEYVNAPYATMVCPQSSGQPLHIMFYNHMGPYNAGRPIDLKVVVGNFLCDIPFEVQIPPHLLSMSVVVAAIPEIGGTDAKGHLIPTGVKVVVYAYQGHDIIARLPKGPQHQ